MPGEEGDRIIEIVVAEALELDRAIGTRLGDVQLWSTIQETYGFSLTIV
jgi:hypothetical protein